MPGFTTIEWRDGAVIMLDQTLLPNEEVYLRCTDYRQVADAIRRLAVRGAPAIGVAGAMGVALGAQEIDRKLAYDEFIARLSRISDELAATRPTAVNLFWGLRRMAAVWHAADPGDREGMLRSLVDEAVAIAREDLEMCRAIGRFGAELVPPNARILTHCNAGALATAGYGTALGVIRAAHEQGKVSRGAGRRDAAAPAGGPPDRLGTRTGTASRSGSSPIRWPPSSWPGGRSTW